MATQINPFDDDNLSREDEIARNIAFNDARSAEEALDEIRLANDISELDESNVVEENNDEPLDNSVNEDDTTDEPVVEDADGETLPEPNEEDEGVNEEVDEPNVETFTIKANGEEFELTLDELKNLASKGINYTTKLQKVSPYRKLISALEEQGITDKDINQFIDMRKGNKAALVNFLNSKNISMKDVEDTDEEEVSNYQPTSYGVESTPFTEKVESLQDRPNYNRLANFVNGLDKVSQQEVINNPDVLDILLADIDRGYFDELYKDANKRKLVDINQNTPFLAYYIQAANSHYDKLSKKASETKIVTSKSVKAGNRDKARITGGKKSSAKSPKVVEMIEDIDEEDYRNFMKNLGL